MLAGLKSGQVQLLNRDDDGNVTVSTNQKDIIGWSVDEILSNFLDVESPTDLRTERRIERLQVLEQLNELTAEQSEENEPTQRND